MLRGGGGIINSEVHVIVIPSLLGILGGQRFPPSTVSRGN